MNNREFDVAVEQRIGLVMYGGISLAIYMNGVAQEFLSLVLSTAHDPTTGKGLLSEEPNPDGRIDDCLTGVQRVYRNMARRITNSGTGPVQTKFVVDILTGTSAGGLNAMYLGKSIAEKVTLKPLQSLWVQEGDISLLLNDKASYQGLFGLPRLPARSLLNSRRMYAKLVAAFAQMEDQPLFKANTDGVDLCTELDVYMTATDLQGKASPVYLGAIDFTPHVASRAASSGPSDNGSSHTKAFQRFQLEAEHRAVFHFRHESQEYFRNAKDLKVEARNDFSHNHVPFLAFVGRCTSSIVPAFEPMRLIDTKDVLEKTGLPFRYDPKGWNHLYRQYWRETPLYFPAEPAAKVIEKAQTSFESRTFGDGGYLDNKPFGYAFRELANRRADVAVRRNVFYVEPHPDDNQKTLAETTEVPDAVPDVVEHGKLALTLPGVQNINERVMAIRDQGEYADRVRRAVDAAKSNNGNAVVNPELASSINLESTIDMLSEVLVDMLGFDPSTAVKPALRHLLHASVEIIFGDVTTDTKARALVLQKLDLKQVRRKVEWLRVRLENKIIETTFADSTTKAEEADAKKKQSLTEELGREYFHLTNPSLVFNNVILALDFLRQGEIAFRMVVPKGEKEPKPTLDNNSTDKELKPVVQDLLDRLDADELQLIFGLLALRINLDELVYVMAAKRSVESAGGIDGARRDRARQILGCGKPFPQRQQAEFTQEDLEVRKARPEIVKAIFDATEKILDLNNLNARIQDWAGADQIAKFEREDNFVFPLLYPAGLGDSYALDITRISPKDASSLEEDESKRVEKLSGVSLGHFGAFFTRSGRILDIIWGRLNAAEIILNTYLDTDQIEDFLPRAQVCILGEALAEFAGEIEVDRLASKAQGHIPLYRRLENLVGFVMAKYPDVTADGLVNEGYLTNSQSALIKQYNIAGGPTFAGETPETETLWSISPRATQVLAQILDESIASKPWFKWPQLIFLYAGRILMLLVEATVPQKPFYRAITYWYQILFTITSIAFVVTQFGFFPHMKGPAGTWMAILIGLWMLTAMIRKWLYRSWKVWVDATSVITLIVAALNLLVGFSVYNVKILDPAHDINAKAAWLLSGSLVVGVVVARLGYFFYEMRTNDLRSKKRKIRLPDIVSKALTGAAKFILTLVTGVYLLCNVALAGWIGANTWVHQKQMKAPTATPQETPDANAETPAAKRDPNQSFDDYIRGGATGDAGGVKPYEYRTKSEPDRLPAPGANMRQPQAAKTAKAEAAETPKQAPSKIDNLNDNIGKGIDKVWGKLFGSK